MSTESTSSIASKLLRAIQTDAVELDVTSTDEDVENVQAFSTAKCFSVQCDYVKPEGNVPARKVWRVTVELVEDSSADD